MNRFFKFLPLSIVIGVVLISCSQEDNNVISDVQSLKIDSVKLASETMTLGSSQSITTYSQFQENCEGFYGYDYKSNVNERVVTALSFKNEDVCGSKKVTGASFINFAPKEIGTYSFRFWQGKNSSGNDIWLTKTIVVN